MRFRSDHGTNFVAVKNVLDGFDFGKVLNEGLRVSWILNPPHASHHGGAWERKIGSVRRVMEASLSIVSNKCLSRDEFCTLLAEAGAIVNNTPLWANPNHPDEPVPLSPAMILTMRDSQSPVGLEQFSESDLLSYGAKRYKRVQYLADQFWDRWRKEFLTTLTRRHKWKTVKQCITKGDLVLVRDKSVPRNSWPMGIVEFGKKSRDRLVRSVTLRLAPLPGHSKSSYLERAISDLVLLVASPEHNC